MRPLVVIVCAWLSSINCAQQYLKSSGRAREQARNTGVKPQGRRGEAGGVGRRASRSRRASCGRRRDVRRGPGGGPRFEVRGAEPAAADAATPFAIFGPVAIVPAEPQAERELTSELHYSGSVGEVCFQKPSIRLGLYTCILYVCIYTYTYIYIRIPSVSIR